ncbi:MAG: C-GCAxxG-C-C family protein [Prolixibacteraceae bacterium]|nr:C-GCAxxG-C-C family protein [Prolixibacteraceae bacterium]
MDKITKQEAKDKAVALFDEGYACSQSVLLTFASQFDLDEKTAKLISSTFGGGMGRLREKCGAVTGGFMVLGLKFGNENPKDMETKLAAYRKVRNLNHLVEEIHGTSSCGGILKKIATEADVAERKHHKIICRRVVGNVTEQLYDLINTK